NGKLPTRRKTATPPVHPHPAGAGSVVSDRTRLPHQSSSASSRNGGAPIRPPAAPWVGLETETVLVTDLYTALGYNRFNRTTPDSDNCSGLNRTVLPWTVTSVTPAARHV